LAFYAKTVLSAAAKFDVRFSNTARHDNRIRAAIETVPEEVWQPIPCWLSTPEVSGADVAQTTYTCFAGDTRHAEPCVWSCAWSGRPRFAARAVHDIQRLNLACKIDDCMVLPLLSPRKPPRGQHDVLLAPACCR
jgi:hypothetical protein